MGHHQAYEHTNYGSYRRISLKNYFLKTSYILDRIWTFKFMNSKDPKQNQSKDQYSETYYSEVI
jgi:hypothetical protein